MRIIKFRAWNKKIKQWCYQTTFNEDGINIENLIQRVNLKLIWVQFTGLKDKNGKEIYEGDILRWKKSDDKYIIRFEPPSFVWEVIRANGERYYDSNQQMQSSEIKQFEVIGNIYENPELLNKG